MTGLLTFIHVFVCIFLIFVVLLQSGRAGGMGVLSGAATQTVFGGRGAGSFLQRVTAICAVLFMITCSALAWISSSTRDRGLRDAPAATTPASSSSSTAPAPSSSSTTTTTPAPSTPTPAPTPAPAAPANPTPAPSNTAPAPAPGH